ncbi:MAG: M55 family metallopeptidase [Candidatus Aminicenantes bacterium]|nr:M55 family metallopeptidase [Candidatus Aminicenantes bacterium]
MKKNVMLLASLVILAGLCAAQQPKPKLKVYISADMEGVWGIVHSDQTSPESPEYGPARKWMTDDVNAVIVGLFEGGATEVVVNDSHGGMRNLIADGLDPRAFLISGSPKTLSMMQGIDGTFQACLFIGYHAKAGTEAAILDHTISSSVVYSIRVNGREMPELGLNGAIAGYFNVPVIMVSGDTALCGQAKSVLGAGTVGVAVKDAVGRYAAKMLPRDDACRLLKEGAKEALLKCASVKPFVVQPPCRFELEFHTSGQAEVAWLVPGVTRADARTAVFSNGDYLEGFRLLRALIALASGR